MKFKDKISLKALLIASLMINVLLIGYVLFVEVRGSIVANDDALFYATLNADQAYYCGEGYDKVMRDIDAMGLNNNDMATRKNVYAMTVCFRNYKTGQDLDLSPLVKQVNETKPETNLE